MEIAALLDVAAVREKLHRAGQRGSRMAEVWNMVRQQVYAAPDDNRWLTPFVALIDENPDLAAAARRAIAAHLDTAEKAEGREYLFNIWCFAFPHARWAIWFDLLRRSGAYSSQEAEQEAARFLLVQHRDHYAGLMVKPHPECVDNQAASLCLSSLIIGTLFADGPVGRHLARHLREAAWKRAETMIGGMPRTGYSEEGSTYHGRIVAFVVPFLVEIMERLSGEVLFDRPLPPNGTSARDILVAFRRLWMPEGLWLPWDHYGYQYGVGAPLAYLAARTEDVESLALLEHEVPWSRAPSEASGWGTDHAAWALAWWPEKEPPSAVPWRSWVEPHLGGVLCDPEGRRYLMQMWDRPRVMCARNHVNPNSVVLAADGIPLTADGVPTPACNVLAYPGTVWERTFGPGGRHRLELGQGCGGSHSVLLLDGDESFRPRTDQWADSVGVPEPESDRVTGDVTDLYRDVYPDCQRVWRRSRLLPVGAWVIEDWAVFDREHEFTSRWWFRPSVKRARNGVVQETPEGIVLQMVSLLGADEPLILRVDGFPRDPDGCSDRVDYRRRGREVRWLWLLWPRALRRVQQVLVSGWQAGPLRSDAGREALAMLPSSPIHPGTLPWLRPEVPVAGRWGFRKEIALPQGKKWWLRLPRGVGASARVWVDGLELGLPNRRSELVPLDVEGPPLQKPSCLVELILDLPVGEERSGEVSCPSSPMAVCLEAEEPGLEEALWVDGWITVRTTAGFLQRWPHELLGTESGA